MTILVVRVDVPPEFLSVVVNELLNKFPVTILEIKEVADIQHATKRKS